MLRSWFLVLAFLFFAAPALAWEANIVEREAETACLILPDDMSFAIEMAETDDQQRRTRIYIPRQPGLSGGSRYFISIHDGQGVHTNTGMVEGSGAAELVYAMLESPRVRLGYSRGARPMEERRSLPLDGFPDEFWNCMRYLGWQGGAAPTPADDPQVQPKATEHAAATADALGAAQAEPPEPGIGYDTRWVEGRQFVLGTLQGIQVWAAFSTDGGPHLFVYLVNAASSGHTFFPEEVRAVAVRRAAGGDLLVPMETFSAEGYEQKEKRKRALIGALYGVATAFANVPTPTTSTVQGYSHGQVSAFGSGGYVTGHSTGSFSGTITTWPTARDHAEARARTAAQVAAMNAQLQASFDAMAATLARRHTLPPDSFYGGIVRFRKERGHQYRIAIPFAGEKFEMTFDMQ